ncbi:hypothetical protein V2J09_014995 [Rumex salicifolius]
MTEFRQQQQDVSGYGCEAVVISDCESGVSGGGGGKQSSIEIFSGGGGPRNLIGVDEEDRVHNIIKQKFLSSLGSGVAADVVAIHRRIWSAAPAQANLMAFKIYLRALAQKNSGIANAKFAWFGTSKAGVEKIIAHGFSHEEINRSPDAVHGRGVYLSPDDYPLNSVQSTVEDENGLRHVLLCKVLLGNMELILPGSDQTHPSSDRFDSGVDSIVTPKRYIVWSTNMNTHILPEFVISFRAAIDSPPQPPAPPSPWMSFPALFGVLSGMLPPDSLCLINNHYNDFKEKRIPRDELVRTIRRVAGDKLLATVIRSFRAN